MATTVQQPYNLFATPKLKRPVQVYDPTKSVQENMTGKGNPSAQNIVSAYQTPQAQLQQAQAQKQTQNQQPKQQFNSPVAEEQARYEKGKALRDRANQQFYSYQQQKAAQDAKAAQWKADYELKVADAARKAGYTEAQIQNMKDRLAQQKAYQEGRLGISRDSLAETVRNNKERLAETKRSNDARISQGNRRISLGWANHNLSKEKFNYLKSKGAGGGSGSGGKSPYEFATPNGKVTMGKNFTQAQKDQVVAKFPQYTNQSEIKRQMMAMGLNTNDPAQVRNYQFAQMLLEHQDVADFVSQKFGGKQTFDNNPLARPGSTTPQPMFQSPWGGAAFADDNPYDQYLLSDEDDSDNDDYEQYLIQ